MTLLINPPPLPGSTYVLSDTRDHGSVFDLIKNNKKKQLHNHLVRVRCSMKYIHPVLREKVPKIVLVNWNVAMSRGNLHSFPSIKI